MWGSQTAPTSQPAGMENSTKISPRRVLIALVGRSPCCPCATLHAYFQLFELANRERGSSYGSLPAHSDSPEAPTCVDCHSLPPACTLWDGDGKLGMMDRLFSYLLLAYGLISARADTIWQFFVLIRIRWVVRLAWELTNPTWLKLTRKCCIA